MDDAITREDVCRAALRHRSALTAYAYVRLRDWSRAEDAVQEAMLVLMDKWQECQSLDTVRAWVQRMVHFKVLEQRRAQTRDQGAGDSLLEDLASTVVEERLDPAGSDLQARRVRALQDCLQRLPEAKRKLIDGYYLQDRSCAQIAVDCDTTPNAVALMLSRLRRILRDCTTSRLGLDGNCA